ncbi:LOW QUALITY PROTEIN: uncharacterized protein LOC128825397 [Malaclemys terrapin pileata]|uniref:LOW QUALITY PROTEIN: uncharacterized protein LOC128825397 n=1 Tax=Malaclemys terrapin pileata TaxID=2991368 RepID=UPI0023A8F3DC|nr:LOW QUALITY PROTEIN: uncharacterized protein LOC128825397 [Malaclemys terrapin pileata]
MTNPEDVKDKFYEELATLLSACFTLPWPAYRGWRGSHKSGRTKTKLRVTPITIGTWNVHTLLDNITADRPERRTALVARELARYNIDIAALSETRLANEGQLSESGGGYTFFWSGRSSDERRESGVGFAIKNHLVWKLASSPKGMNDRLMTMQLPLQKGKQAILISAYVPTMTNPEDVKDKFYEELDTLLWSVHRTDKLILLGDFNARVGCDAAAWEGVIGKNGVGKRNSNGLLLLKTCAAHDLLISKTVFRLPTGNRTSWMYPRSKHWHLIDYVIIRRRDRQDVRVTKTVCGADCWTDHRLIVSKMKVHIMLKRRQQGCKALKRINVSQQDWFDKNDAEIQALLAEKHCLHHAYQNDPSSVAKKTAFINARRTVQNQLRKMRDLWLSVKADEIQAYADRNAYKQFYEALNTLYTEVYKVGGPVLLRKVTELFQSFWKQGTIPQEFRDASILHLSKRKGNCQLCDNHRGISLLSTAGKVLARVLLNRLITHLEKGLLPESQCGFYKGRGTIDMIFAVRQLQEKCQEQNRELYTTFVDLTKAFDSVSCQGLWRIMSKFGCPDRFIRMVRQFHHGMMARVLDDGETSEAFPVTNGVKQGCVLAPTLFSMIFSATLTDAFQHCSEGVGMKYRTDRKLFNLRRLHAITKVKETVLQDFLFADDCALNASTEPEMQASMDKFSTACNNFGLTINIKKTEVLHQPAPHVPYSEPSIIVNGQRLQPVDRFMYLSSTLSRAVSIDDEVNCRIAKASSAFGRLRSSVWERRGISLPTKLKVYRAVVLPTLLYACETWTVYRSHARRLNHFHISCLRKLLKIRWQDKVPDTDVLTRASLPSVHTLLMRAQTRWAGHGVRMSDEFIPKQLFYGELTQGKRSHGGQKMRFKNTLKTSLKSLEINTATWETFTLNRPAWRSLIHTGSNTSEARRIAEAEKKRELRKARAACTSSTVP